MRISKKTISAGILSSFLILPILGSLFFSPTAQADQDLIGTQVGFEEVGHVFGGKRAEQDPRALIANIILIALGFLSVIFLGITVAAGFQFMTAGGNTEKAAKAAGLLKNAIIGLVIVLSAWAITRYAIVILNRAAVNGDIYYYPPRGM